MSYKIRTLTPITSWIVLSRNIHTCPHRRLLFGPSHPSKVPSLAWYFPSKYLAFWDSIPTPQYFRCIPCMQGLVWLYCIFCNCTSMCTHFLITCILKENSVVHVHIKRQLSCPCPELSCPCELSMDVMVLMIPFPRFSCLRAWNISGKELHDNLSPQHFHHLCQWKRSNLGNCQLHDFKHEGLGKITTVQ